VRLETADTDERRAAWLRLLLAFHEERWRSRGGSEAFFGRGILEFHEDVTRLALEKGWLRLLALTLDREPAAIFYGFRYRSRFLYYQLGWDPRLSHRSGGLTILGLAIRQAIDEGAETFEFLHGSESYKFLWARETRSLRRLDAFPPGPRGRVLNHALGATRACRRLAKRALGGHLRRRIGWVRRVGIVEALRAAIPR
jgi:CelD/BcsL family acetyltransferase involved in cellulose biosynthesis